MTQNRWLVGPVVVGLLACPALLAQVGRAQEAAARADDGAEAMQALLDEYQDAYDAYTKALRAAKTNEERRAIPRVDPAEFVPRVRALAEKHPGGETAAKGLQWIYLNTRGGDDKDWALEVLAREHVGSEAIGEVCMSMARAPITAETEALVRAVAERNPHHKAQGQAKYALGNMLLAMHEVATDGPEARRYQRQVDTEHLKAYLPEALEKEYLALFEELAEKYDDIPYRGKQTLGARAEGALFKKTRLQVGMVAPDIEGEDVDGVPFKLSDYHGKVILVDFWGHW